MLSVLFVTILSISNVPEKTVRHCQLGLKAGSSCVISMDLYLGYKEKDHIGHLANNAYV